MNPSGLCQVTITLGWCGRRGVRRLLGRRKEPHLSPLVTKEGAPMKTRRDSVLDQVSANGWEPELSAEDFEAILSVGLRNKSLPLACVAIDIARRQQPLTIRGL